MAISLPTKIILFVGILTLLVVAVGATALWNGTSNTLVRELDRRASMPSDIAIGDDTLPAPVARFLAHSLPPGQRRIRTATLEQSGEFFLNGQWLPFTARQFFAATPPAFMWDARIRMGRLLSVYVRDAYIAGGASMRARVLGIYPVVNQANTPELKSGALMRYLGEASWLPTRLMPGDGLTWTPIDDDHATATLTDGDTSVSLQFTFDADGAITEIYSSDRFREVNGSYVKTPWRVRALGHEVKSGIRLMSPAEVEWVLPDGPQPVLARPHHVDCLHILNPARVARIALDHDDGPAEAGH
ncbi:MAG: hypothetical protein QM736_19940 [Vicinamibacterales bacterium]